MAVETVSTALAGAELSNQSLPLQAIVLLGAALIFAPIFKKLGLGTVLGYLASGIVLGLLPIKVADGEALLHFSELGIVFLLFIIGLELKPARLWALRRGIFGYGFLQVALSAIVIGGVLYIFGQSWQVSLLVGLGLAQSSTAFAMQILNENGDLNSRHGQSAFSIVLFQDIALVPILALVPFLVPEFLKGLVEVPVAAPDWMDALQVIGVGAGLIFIGHYLLNPLFRIIANTGAREMMIVVALFVVLGAALASEAVGLSMALGAFFAGVMLAESSYRPELEANIEPFRGLLLGLFFIAVGLSLDLGVIIDNWAIVLFAAPAVMIVKALVIYAIIRGSGKPHNDAIRIAALLPQVGEFAFVIFSAASAAFVVSTELASIVTAIVTVTMALTPVFTMLGKRLMRSKLEEEVEEDFDGADGTVFVIGFGRFGQIVCQTLLARGINVTVIDHNAERIKSAARFGFRIYYGEGRRIDVLRAAGIENARLVAVCSDTRGRTNEIVALVKKYYPEMKLYVRAYDRAHTLELHDMEVDFEIREMFESALSMGHALLDGMDTSAEQASMVIDDVRKRDQTRLQIQKDQGMFAPDPDLYTVVTPEPLSAPQKPAKTLSAKTEQIAKGTN